MVEKLRDQWHLVFEDLQDASYQNEGFKASQKAQLAELLQAYQEAREALQPPAPWRETYLNVLSTSPDNVIHSTIHPIKSGKDFFMG